MKLGLGAEGAVFPLGLHPNGTERFFINTQVNNYMTFSGFGIPQLPFYGQRNDTFFEFPGTPSLKVGKLTGKDTSFIEKPITQKVFSRQANYLNNNLQKYETQRLVAPPDCSVSTIQTNLLPFYSVATLVCLGLIVFSATEIKNKIYNNPLIFRSTWNVLAMPLCSAIKTNFTHYQKNLQIGANKTSLDEITYYLK